jgi:protein-S-isoprenylcysteine O-methyltransferase Ste14
MRLLIRLVAVELLLAAIMFGAARRLDLPWFWALIGVHGGILFTALRHIDPDLLRERFRPAPGGLDRGLRFWIMPFMLAQLIIAGLDVGRFGWSGPVPLTLHVIGLVAFASGLALTMRAMIANRFFSPVVRIQQERGHRLITAGPYRFVRHPGYAGMLLSSLGQGLLLGSWWSFLPLIPIAGLILRRIILEDQYLRQQLEGYNRYAEQVRYRLLPGAW